mmetsp:Transcript_9312/g.15159  ORF Transcript_9312/g.15159 Transcript_9312/m.15159 type:complete len:300 (+) Transcript_9312:154-1053(+)
MFSKSSFDLFKERTFQRVQEQLEQVGIKNNFIEERANNFGDDRLVEMLKRVDGLSKALENIIEAATAFHKGACLLRESAKLSRAGIEECPELSQELKSEGATLEQCFDEQNLRKELQNNVTKPVRIKLRYFADLKNRIKEVEIFRLEMVARKENAEKVRSNAKSTPVQIGKAEDMLAEKSVQFEQSMLRLMDEYAVLKRDHEKIYSRLFASLKMCEYRFLMSAQANLGTICSEESTGVEASNLLSPAEVVSPAVDEPHSPAVDQDVTDQVSAAPPSKQAEPDSTLPSSVVDVDEAEISI